MTKYIKSLFLAALIGFTACSEDFLTVQPTSSQEAGGPATEGAILANLGATYQILLFDSYADFQFNSVPLMSDLRSDDIYKGGGDAGDQAALYRLSQLALESNDVPTGLWNIYYSGLSRANNAIIACENAVDVDEDRLAQYNAEAHYLRAYYVHWLWKFWGNIPYFEEDLEEPYMARQYTADEVYAELMADLAVATAEGVLPMNTTSTNDGRATRAAAMMLKARVVMYQKDASKYAEVMADMQTIVSEGGYSLPDYASIWARDGEFGAGSIFEANHLPEGKDWGAAWTGFGTNLPRFVSPNELKGDDLLSGADFYEGGWGFGPVRTELVSIFEDGDKRLAGSINQFAKGTYTERFQNTGYFMAKYAARADYADAPYTPDLNFENNVRIFRYAEALLNIAELEVVHGVAAGAKTAQSALDDIRERAGLESIAANVDNIKLERRREFVGEGMRFWDLVRWGEADVLTENIPDFSSNRTWADYKKYLPIPQSEIDKTEGEFKLVQNEGYN
ncbi:RagB/SusD family nutrient uptake outer membrane protein [Carboxylicivirga mesophila]|uniref:RagB/SusD family nutrient uptake outer membrane protein n=1 Tax=Carboxylicivirga mesophila TaxID=1166478 RepID=A0ABS5K5Q2_9BACT|nr:RagB/SusD family nutrient uptake outer membrane protein [Carboxylicivirga mesophila]MBS2210300.1 RagB/SusD family nutrient uptake outer membrane protein [Carboxylicivirga mesophila]